MTSADGLNWTRSGEDALQDVEVAQQALAYGNGQFVGLGLDRTDPDYAAVVLTSADGVDGVTRKTDSLPSWNIHQMVFANGQFVAVGGSYPRETNAIIFTSADGINWVQQDSPTTDGFVALRSVLASLWLSVQP
jgi:hypothetical protein